MRAARRRSAGFVIAALAVVAPAGATERAEAAAPASIDPGPPPIQKAASDAGSARRVGKAPLAAGAASPLDPSFGGDGRVTTSFEPGGGEGYDLALAPDGKIVVAGDEYNNDRVAAVRYLANGALDTAFGGNGRVATTLGMCGFAEGGVAVQPDGKVVVAAFVEEPGDPCGTDGEGDFAVIRYNANGALDATFGDGGIARTNYPGDEFPLDLTLQPDGKVVVVGQFETSPSASTDLLVVRFRANGTLDTELGGVDGGVYLDLPGSQDAAGVAVQPDGKLVAAGRWEGDFFVARFRPDGSLDDAFGGGGLVRTDFGSARDLAERVALQPDGRIVVAGHTDLGDGDFALARYQPDGSLDPGFGGDGGVITDLGGFDWGDDVAVGPRGEIVVSGWSDPFGPMAVARFRPDGSLDPAFGRNGRVKTWFGAEFGGEAAGVAVQPDGKVVVGGWACCPASGAGPFFAAVRYRANYDLKATVRIRGKRVRFNRARRGRVRLVCPAREASPPCAGRVQVKTRRKVRFGGRKRRVKIAGARFRVPAGKTKRVRVKVSPRKRQLLRKSPKARSALAIARVRDQAGNRGQATKRVRVSAR